MLLVLGARSSDGDEAIDFTKLLTLTKIYRLIDEGHYDASKYEEAIDQLRPLVWQRNHEAEFVLGTMKELGQGGPPDMTKALELYHQSAEGGYIFAISKLAHYYYFQREYDEAFPFLLQLARMGARGIVPIALAEMYEHGWGTAVDLEKSACWRSKDSVPLQVDPKDGC